MKVLLLGEYSGVHTLIKKGLQELGIQVKVATSGDGWKGFKSDIYLGSNKANLGGKISRTLFPVINKRKLTGFDIVQMINPVVFNKYLLLYTRMLVSAYPNVVLLCAGCDSYFYKYNKLLDYNPCAQCKELDIQSKTCIYEEKKIIALHEHIINKAERVIPLAWDYDFCCRKGGIPEAKLEPVIPMPVDTDEIKFTEIAENRKIVVYHPLNRVGYKGTNEIKQAFEILKEKYKNDAEFIVKGRMQVDEYLTFLKGVDIVVDQMNSYAYGMNALYSMAMGKVVLSGLENAAVQSKYEFYRNCPVINIKPQVENIVKTVEDLLENRNKLKQKGFESRSFVEKYHHYRKIANQYLEVYNKIMDI